MLFKIISRSSFTILFQLIFKFRIAESRLKPIIKLVKLNHKIFLFNPHTNVNVNFSKEHEKPSLKYKIRFYILNDDKKMLLVRVVLIPAYLTKSRIEKH